MWSPSSSTTERRRLFQAEMFLRISVWDNDWWTRHSWNQNRRGRYFLPWQKISCPLMPARLIYLSSLVHFFLQRVRYSVTFCTLWRPFILFDESCTCSLLQIGLGYPTCVRSGPISVKYIIVSRKKSSTSWEKIVIQQLYVVFTINLGSISVNKIMFVFPSETPAETISHCVQLSCTVILVIHNHIRSITSMNNYHT